MFDFISKLTVQECAQIQAVASFASLLALLLIAVQIHASYKQIKSTTKWNKASTTLQAIDIDSFLRLEEAAIAACQQLSPPVDLDGHHEVSHEQAMRAWDDANAKRALRHLTAFLERLCTAYRSGCLDAKLVQTSIGGPWIVRYYPKLKEFIEVRRKHTGNPEAYMDFEETALKLQPLYAPKGKRLTQKAISG